MAVLLAAIGCFAQESLVKITSPADNTIVLAGDTITIKVSSHPSVKFLSVIADGHLGNPGQESNGQFSLDIPVKTIPGDYHLTAVGVVSKNTDLQESQITIHVEPRELPISIEFSEPNLAFSEIGNQMPTRVIGTFNDLSTLDLTDSHRTSFSSDDPKVASVDKHGIVTATGPGETIVWVMNGDHSGILFVDVSKPPPSGPPPVITEISPIHGVPGVTKVTIKGIRFGDQPVPHALVIGIRDKLVIHKWTDSEIVVTVPDGARTGWVSIALDGLYSNEVKFVSEIPQIQEISEFELETGMEVKITGIQFGEIPGTVTFEGKPAAKIRQWRDTEIFATAPDGLKYGKLKVCLKDRCDFVYYSLKQ